MLAVRAAQVNQGLYTGAWLGCEIVSAVLFGILTVQCSVYFDWYQQDKRWLKGLVSILWLIEFLTQIIAGWTTYVVTIQFSSPSYAFDALWGNVVMGVLGVSNAVVVQLFYARRGYLLNKSLWPLSLISVVIALISFGLGLATSIELVTMPQTQQAFVHRWSKDLWFCAEASTDLIVAIIVVYSLRASAREYGHSSSGLRGLILYTIGSGILMTIITIIIIILFNVLPNSWTYNAVSLVAGRIYAVSLLTSLNLRGTWINAKTNASSDLSTVPTSNGSRKRRSLAPRPRPGLSLLTLTDPEGLPMTNLSSSPSHPPSSDQQADKRIADDIAEIDTSNSQ
ncbi:hypothetical protein DL93DRAFT_2083825 [Clavulina sp. PMI_390]|nr:hypothetical protein DL93DRAFT_2083825 [Clavulina sp. PMI_390]